MSYRFLEHTADIKFEATGETIEQTFISCLNALNETIRGDIKILDQEKKSINIEGKDLENLLYNFLEEFIYLLDAENFLCGKVEELKIDTGNFKLNAKISGDKASNYKFTNDVKAITYNEMFIKKEEEIWKAQVVLDV